MRLRTKIFILVASLLLFTLAGILGVIQWNLKKDIRERTRSRLDQAQASFLAREEQRFLLLGTMARTLEVNPSLRLIMNRTNRATLESFLEDVRVESSVDLILLSDLQGEILAVRGGELEDTSELGSVEQALVGQEALDYWRLAGGIYQVYSVPLTSGDLVDGTVSLATRIDDSVLQRAAKEIGVEFVVRVGAEQMASSFSFQPRLGGLPSDTIESEDRTFTYRVVPLEGSAQAELLILNDLSPSVALLKETRLQLFLIGGLAFLLVLASSWPLIERVTVSSQLLETVVETVGEGLLQLDTEGRIVRVNPVGEELLGLSKEELLNRPFGEVVTVLPKGFNPGEATRLEDVTIRTRKADFPASVVATPFRSNTGHSGTVLIIRDISHVKQTEEQLRLAAQAKADFLAHMSHEIRTPMNGVLGMNALLLKTPLSSEQVRYAKTIDNAGQSLLKILNDVLDHSKLEAEAVELEEIEFDLRATLEEVAFLLSPRAGEKNIELVVALDSRTPYRVISDPVRLSQVLMNLISNAVKFTSRGKVVLSTLVLEDKIRFQVEDTGVGISEESMGRLFTDFSQAEASTTRQYGGTGLGLSISARLVRMLGGRIEVESTLGEGSRFWFDLTLPEVEGAPSPSLNSQENSVVSEPPLLTSTAPLVLVVDDNELNREVAEASLAKLGYRSMAASSGVEALKMVAREKFYACLMDCEMPELDGFETTRLIHGENPELPVIALTAALKPQTRSKAEECGMLEVLLKPFSLQELGEILARYTSSSILSEGTVLNVERLTLLKSLRENDPHFVRNLIEGYLVRLEQALESLKKARENELWDEVSAIAHKQSGAAGNLGLETLQAAAGFLEEQTTPDNLDKFDQACVEAKAALQEYLEKEDEVGP